MNYDRRRIKIKSILESLFVSLEAAIIITTGIFAGYSLTLTYEIIWLLNVLVPLLIVIFVVQIYESILKSFISLFVITFFFIILFFILLIIPTFFGLVDNIGLFYAFNVLETLRHALFVFLYSIFGYVVGLIIKYIVSSEA